MKLPEKTSGDWFYDITFGENAHYKNQVWLSGRTTTDDNFTNYRNPVFNENTPEVPQGDFVIETNLNKYYISVDPAGKLDW